VEELNKGINTNGGIPPPPWQEQAGIKYGLRAKYATIKNLGGEWALYLPKKWVELCVPESKDDEPGMRVVGVIYDNQNRIIIDPNP
jgi:hypothetical protein